MKRFFTVLALLLLALPAASQPSGFEGPAPTRYFNGTIASGGAFQQLVVAAQGTRRSVDFVNICNIAGNCNATTDNCYILFAASGGSIATAIPVPPGWEYLRSQGSIPGDAIRGTCDGTGDAYYLAVQ